MSTSLLPTNDERALEIEQAFEHLMNLVRPIVSDEMKNEIIDLWAGANYNSRALGWSEGWEIGYDVAKG